MDSATTQGGSRDLSKGPEHHWSEQAGAGGLDLRKDGAQPPTQDAGLVGSQQVSLPHSPAANRSPRPPASGFQDYQAVLGIEVRNPHARHFWRKNRNEAKTLMITVFNNL